MGKNKEMLKTFTKVMNDDDTAAKLVLPQHYVKTIQDIDYQELLNKGYKNLMFDIDNTIMPVNDTNVTKELKDFFETLKKDFNICILSNNEEARVLPIMKELKVKGIFKANKPNKEALDKALGVLHSDVTNTVMIGDQMLSDIVFANKYGLFAILVEPYKKKYDLKTGTSRVLQNILMKKLKNKMQRYHYY